MTEKDRESEFRVVDRRRFTESGETRPNVDARQDVGTPSTPPRSEPRGPTPRPQSVPPQSAPPLQGPRAGVPGIEFSHFVLSLATSAQMALGLVANPESNVVHRDLGAARQTIDIIAMLQEKTAGNLSPEEAKLLEEIIYTLRVQYVQVTQQGMPPRHP